MTKLVCEKTEILEPKHPNKSTGIFTGVSSGILNWNDLLYPQMHKIRTKIRDTFYVASTYETELTEKLTKEEQDKLVDFLVMTQEVSNKTSVLESLATDPTLVSIMATMADHSYEHIRSILRIDRDLAFDNIELEEVEQPKNMKETLNLIKDITAQKEQITKNMTSVKTKLQNKVIGIEKVVEHIIQDMENHILFLNEIYKIGEQEAIEKGLI